MSLKNDTELDNTRAKLLRLEKRYEELRDDTHEDEHVRELTMRSLKGTINQFKEEIARYEAHPGRSNGSSHGNGRGDGKRRILNEIELTNTRKKLAMLESMYETHERETGDDVELREMSMTSLKKLINQLKEEILWTEAHQPARG